MWWKYFGYIYSVKCFTYFFLFPSNVATRNFSVQLNIWLEFLACTILLLYRAALHNALPFPRFASDKRS